MKGFLDKRNRDYYGGTLLALLGAGTIFQGTTYGIGTLRHMGSGFFPVAIGAILVLTGLAIALGRKNALLEGEEDHFQPEWRGWICITLGIIAFIVLGKYGGLIPATFAVVFIAALGDRQNTIKDALILSLIGVAACVVIFWWALEIQMPLFRWY